MTGTSLQDECYSLPGRSQASGNTASQTTYRISCCITSYIQKGEKDGQTLKKQI